MGAGVEGRGRHRAGPALVVLATRRPGRAALQSGREALRYRQSPAATNAAQ
jgi:hypothetical protein